MNAATILRFREHLGWTQDHLAAKLEVNRRTVIRWEVGDSRPSRLATSKLKTLARHRGFKL